MKRGCCAYPEAIGWQGQVYMRALPVWKLSVDSHQTKAALWTHSPSPRNVLHSARGRFREGSSKVTLTIVKRRCCAWHEATGCQGRVYMRALPVWKLSVDSQQPTRVLLTVTTECDPSSHGFGISSEWVVCQQATWRQPALPLVLSGPGTL